MGSLKGAWGDARDSLWLVPSLFTLAGAALSFALMMAERRWLNWTHDAPAWVYQGSADAARTVLNTITGSLITVTGVVFSMTIVAVQLASSQYSPRVLRNFITDRGNQMVLGIFIGTFTFGVLVMSSIRGEDGLGAEFIPRLSITVAVLLLMGCVVALVFFINHVAQEIRVTTILQRITAQTLGNVHQLFPEHIGHADEAPPPDPRLAEHDSVPVCVRKAGHLTMVDEDRLFSLGAEQQVVIGMVPKVGDYLLPGARLASVQTGGPLTPELEEAIRGAFVLGPERMPDQDVEFGIVQISDIGIKALSPSVNDPTTAVRCIDRLSQILAELGMRKPPEARRTREGAVRFVATYTSFERAVKVAFDDIRHFGAPIPLIAEHLLEILGDLTERVPEGQRGVLVEQARAVLFSAREEITNPLDLAGLDRAAQWLSAFPDDAPLGSGESG